MCHDLLLHRLLVLCHPPLLGHGELAGLVRIYDVCLDDAMDVELVVDQVSPCDGCSMITWKMYIQSISVFGSDLITSFSAKFLNN